MSIIPFVAQILFIGHSLVGPTLPVMLEEAYRADGITVQVDAQIIDGAPLKTNWDQVSEVKGINARVALSNGAYDTVIMTEAVPLAGNIKYNKSAVYAWKYYDLAVSNNPETQVFMYETWSSLKADTDSFNKGDPNASAAWRGRLDQDYRLWKGIVDYVNLKRPAYVKPMALIPAGQAMAMLHDEIAAGNLPDLETIYDVFSDDIHLNYIGLYFVALVHYAATSDNTPVGLPNKLTSERPAPEFIISDKLALGLQKIAWEAVQIEGGFVVTALQTENSLQDVTVENGATKITNPSLALGLTGIADWAIQQPFIDIMKTARQWTGHKPGQWGGWEHDDLLKAGHLDENGWVKTIPDDVVGVATLVLTDYPEQSVSASGTYRMTYDGKGKLKIDGLANNIRTRPGEIFFDYTAGSGEVIITLRQTDPEKTGDYIRNIQIVHTNNLQRHMDGELFNPIWLNRIRGVKVIRFMDWMNTNNSTLVTPDQRPKPLDYTYSRVGVPVEVMVALANELDASPWFTLPHRANDAFMATYAKIVKNALSTDLQAYVEFSNEVWNWQFHQASWANEQAQAEWGQENKWVQFYGTRAAEMAHIWTEIYGEEAPKRLVRVVATQTGWPGLEEEILNAPARRDGVPSPAYKGFDAYAITGYFSALLGSEEKAPIIRSWVLESVDEAEKIAKENGLADIAFSNYVNSHKYDHVMPLAVQELRDGSLTGQPEDSLNHLLNETFPYQSKVARDHGLELVMYEGGTHVVGMGSWVDDPELSAFFGYLNYSPEMATLYSELMKGWSTFTSAPFNAFVDVAYPSKWGSWGGLRFLTDENPRWSILATGP